MHNPEVSIIITNYNYGKFLARCIRSCLAQKSVKVEVIVVDDKSSDESMEVLDTFQQDVRVIRNGRNLGVSMSANRGIRAAKSQFVVRVDSDDFISSDMCYFMKTYLEANHDAFCVSCDYFLVDRYENVTKRKYAESVR